MLETKTHQVDYSGSGPVIFQSQKVSLMSGFIHMPLHANVYNINCINNPKEEAIIYTHHKTSLQTHTKNLTVTKIKTFTHAG